MGPDEISLTLAFTRHEAGVFAMGFGIGAVIFWALGLFIGSSGKGTDSAW